MKKLVKVVVTTPPVNLPRYIMSYGTHGPLEMSIEDIFQCITRKARVVEIIGDKEVVLTLSNYNKDNGANVITDIIPTTPTTNDTVGEKAEERPVQEEPVVEPEVHTEGVNAYGFPSFTSADPGADFVPETEEEEDIDPVATPEPPVVATKQPQNNSGKGKNNGKRR